MGDTNRVPRITSDDPRYALLLRKRFNKRFSAEPDWFHVPKSPEEVSVVVERAVAEERRVSVQSGGHCLEGFVSEPSVRVVIDLSLLSRVHYDEAERAFSVGGGATLGEAQRALFLGWGVFLPAGQSPDIGVGGHVLGGGFGFLHRLHGLAVDHLVGVELVHIDQAGRARVVLARRDDEDEAKRELFWAHTGAGGGNFGIVTRYLFRDLPRAPRQITTSHLQFDWPALSRDDFVALLRNFGAFHEREAAPDTRFRARFSVLTTGRPAGAPLHVRSLVADAEDARLLDAFEAALLHEVNAKFSRERATLAWLDFALNPFPDLFATGPLGVTGGGAHTKLKDALLKRRLSDDCILRAHAHLTERDADLAGGSLGLASYGGAVNARGEDETCYAQRDAVMDLSCGVGWQNEADAARSLAWVRALYGDLFAETGGVPVPGEAYDGALINHPDTDLADPAWNRSGLPWHTFYYKHHYARLQRVKAAWDPHDVFHHALSVGRA